MLALALFAVLLSVLRIVVSTLERPGFYSLPEPSRKLKEIIPIACGELNAFNSSWIEFEPHLSVHGAWKIVPVNTLGVWSPYAVHFPQTCQALQQIDFRNAMFSKLGPNVKLKPHRGYAFLANNQLRCHLVLQSNSKCKLVVNGRSKRMKPGDVIIFDDAETHSAENNGSEDRLVLIVDIPRPDHIPRGRSTEAISSNLFEAAAEIGLSAHAFKQLSDNYL